MRPEKKCSSKKIWNPSKKWGFCLEQKRAGNRQSSILARGCKRRDARYSKSRFLLLGTPILGSAKGRLCRAGPTSSTPSNTTPRSKTRTRFGCIFWRTIPKERRTNKRERWKAGVWCSVVSNLHRLIPNKKSRTNTNQTIPRRTKISWKAEGLIGFLLSIGREFRALRCLLKFPGRLSTTAGIRPWEPSPSPAMICQWFAVDSI